MTDPTPAVTSTPLAPPRRARGEGTVELLPSGRASVRIRAGRGVRQRLGTYESVELADKTRAAAVEALAEAGIETTGAETLRSFGPTFLDHREVAEKRSNIRTDRNRWKNHVAESGLASMPLSRIEPSHIYAFVDHLAKKTVGDPNVNAKNRTTGPSKKKLDRQTVKHVLNLVRTALDHAVRRGILRINPAVGVKVPGANKERLNGDEWTYLLPAEQERLTTAPGIPEVERDLYAFAIGSGLREGEVFCLQLRDVHAFDDAPFVYVRWGSKGKPPKNGKCRRVQLFGMALDAARRQVGRLQETSKPNPRGLLWPSIRGVHRACGKPPRGWREHLKAAGLADPKKRHDGRSVRFHDLRHTCASSLVAGWFGHRWSLDEVRELLGHSSRTVTERYAHLAESVLDETAKKTTGPARGGGSSGGSGGGQGGDRVGQRLAHADSLDVHKPLARPAGFEPATRGLEGRGLVVVNQELSSRRGPIVGQSTGGEPTRLAEDVLRAVATGDAMVARGLSTDLARLVLDAPLVDLAERVLAGGDLWAAHATRLADLVLAVVRHAGSAREAG